MSLIQLLVDFPNYSARRVRRLAKQIAFVQQVADHSDEPNVAKGIEQDLMEYNLLCAQREAQLNDDVSVPIEPQIHPLPKSKRIHVTPSDAARRAIDEMVSWIRVNTDANLKREDLEHLIAKCHGIIHGQSFYTDRTVIQARLSPQEKLDLNNGEAS